MYVVLYEISAYVAPSYNSTWLFFQEVEILSQWNQVKLRESSTEIFHPLLTEGTNVGLTFRSSICSGSMFAR